MKTLCWYMSEKELRSVKREETLVPLELVPQVKRALEWMESLGPTYAPES